MTFLELVISLVGILVAAFLFTLLLRQTPLTAKVMMGAGSLYAVFIAVAIY